MTSGVPRPEASADTDASAAPVLEKTARILSAFEGRRPTLSLTDVVRHTGLSRTTVHRLMGQLVELGWLGKDGRRYFLGLGLLELGAFASHLDRLRRAALPHLIALHEATGHWVQLFVQDGAEVLCLEQIGDPRRSSLPYQVGTRLPVHCTAAGKALLAFGGATAVERLLAGRLLPRTRNTLIRGNALRSELTTVHSTGVAYDREECFQGVTCVAAPLRGSGRALAAVSLSRGPGPGDLDRLARQVARCAGATWALLFDSSRRFEEARREVAEPVPDSDAEGVMAWLFFSEWE
ncbi:IclR family transcriptional regulator [Streptomyces malaysiensis]|uniref:IclR family transcriptional regulator n=1 Tax=Streptomyces malaysiensis TaxID=92644 RepID=UPI002B2FC2C3|nr:IclR family transcriptional regulator [Streptomyces malaysiensis]